VNSSFAPRTFPPAPAQAAGPLTHRRPEPIVLRPARSEATIAAATLALVGFGFVMVFNTSYFYASERFGDPYLFTRKHALALALGGALALLARRVSTAFWRRAAYPALGLAAVGLLAVLLPGVGDVRSGARRWLELGGFTVQPSEGAKLAVALYTAHSIAKKGEGIRRFWTGYLPHWVLAGGCIGAILLEPDFGAAVLLGAFLFLMLLAAGARGSHLVATAALALAGLAAGMAMSAYRIRRWTAFLDPWRDPQASGFQLVQSLLAFGAGGFTGVGLGAGRQKMHYLPEAHTDFVFAVIGEELGILGTFAVLAAFALLGAGGYRLVLRHPDPFAAWLAFGITSLLLLQAAVNMGVAVGLLPTKGLTLPFLSYGGSALVVNLIEVGILLGIAREAK
jgi:cell division protein FtsW